MKELSRSEAKYKYIGLSKKIRDYFPEKYQIFKAKFQGKTYYLKVNNKDCIMLTELYHVHQFSEGENVKFTKINEELFEILLV